MRRDRVLDYRAVASIDQVLFETRAFWQLNAFVGNEFAVERLFYCANPVSPTLVSVCQQNPRNSKKVQDSHDMLAAHSAACVGKRQAQQAVVLSPVLTGEY